MIPFLGRSRRGRVLLAMGVLAGIFVAWSIVGAIKVRSTVNELAAVTDAFLSQQESSTDLSRVLDRVSADAASARASLEGLRWWILPLRAGAPVLRAVPGPVGDAGQVGRLLDYVTELSRAGEDLAGFGQAVSSQQGDLSSESIDSLIRIAESNRSSLSSAERALAAAASIRSKVDEAVLSAGSRTRLATADDLAKALQAALRVSSHVEPLARAVGRVWEDADELYEIGNEGGVTRLIARAPSLLDDRATIQASLKEIGQRLRRMKPDLLTLMNRLEEEGKRFEADIDHGIRVVEALETLVDAMGSIPTLRGGFAKNPEEAQALRDALVDLSGIARDLRDELEDAAESFLASKIPSQAPKLVGQLGEASDFLLHFLGFRGRRQHMVVAQDDEELRATGGFLGGVWMLQVKNGQLLEREFISSYAVDEEQAPRSWISAPRTFRLGFGSSLMPFRDQNWWPHFPFVAEQLRRSYSRLHGIRPSAVLALNQGAIGRILGAVGPVTVSTSAGPIQISEESARGYLQEGNDGIPDEDIPSGWDEQRYATFLLGSQILDGLTEGDADQNSKLAAALSRSANTGDLLISASDPAGRALFRKLGWDGALDSFDGDGFYLVESNAFSPKISHLLERSFLLETELDDGGNSRSTLRISYENPIGYEGSDSCSQPAISPSPPCYWTVMRLYFPVDAVFEETPEMPLPAGSVATLSRRTGEPTLRISEGVDGLPIRVNEVSGLGVIPPEESREWQLRYRLPQAARRAESDIWRYTLSVPHQPGLRNADLRVRIEAPSNSCYVEVPAKAEVDGSKAEVALPLRESTRLEFTYGRCEIVGAYSDRRSNP